MSTAVITIVSGRHRHLENQQRGLRSGTRLPEHYVVVAMDDPEALRLTASGPLSGSACTIHPVPIAVDRGLPLAAARNAGATAALAAGADTLIFLDVDCVPSPSLVQVYSTSVAAESVPALHCGVVRYLGADVDAGAVPAARVVRAGASGQAQPGAGHGHLVPGLAVVLVVVVRRLQPRPGGSSADFTRSTSVTAPKTPTWGTGRFARACTCAGWAAPTPTTSTTRPRVRRSATLPTSSTTQRSSTAAGDSGRCRAGSTPSRNSGWPTTTRSATGGCAPASAVPLTAFTPFPRRWPTRRAPGRSARRPGRRPPASTPHAARAAGSAAHRMAGWSRSRAG